MQKRDRTATPKLKAASDAGTPTIPTRPLVQQPLVGVSLVLIAATLAQFAIHGINARLLDARLSETPVSSPSALIVNNWAYDTLLRTLDHVPGAAENPQLSFGLLLVLGLASTVGWYTVARKMLGPAWGLWCGIACGLYPLPAFLIQRPGPLTLSLVVVPFAWATLLWWNRCRRRRVGLLAGVLSGLACLISIASGVAFLIASSLLFASGGMSKRSLQSFPLLLLGFALPLLGIWVVAAGTGRPGPFQAFPTSMIRALEDSGSPLARAIHVRFASQHQPPLREVVAVAAAEFAQAPLNGMKWTVVRAWQTLYTTSGGHFQRPLFAVQLVILLPALWGLVVCMREPLWRWPAVANLVLVIAHWTAAAVTEALARGLAPVGGVFVLFALVGVFDWYERAFGRKLEAHA